MLSLNSTARLGSITLAVLLPLGLAACGGSDGDSQADATPSATPADSSTTADTAATGGYTPPPVPEEICTAVTADEMSDVFGADVTVDVTSDTDCTFTVTGKKITIRLLEAYDDTSLATAAETIKASYGKPEQVEDLGVPAIVAVGKLGGKGDVQGAGAVLRETYATGVLVSQQEGLSAATVKDGTIKVMGLVADQA